MPVQRAPKVGQILYCDFSQGFKEPEMVKRGRPVIVIAPAGPHRPGLVTVAALSTREPVPRQKYHWKLPPKALPMIGDFQRETWLKGDMIYSVGLHRLDLIKLGKKNQKTGKREYFTNRLGRENMRIVYQCVMHGMNLPQLAEHV